MDVPLKIGRKEVESIFGLLGDKENDITKSVGWALAKCPGFRNRLAAKIGFESGVFDEVSLQRHDNDGGYTDIELIGPNHHVIVEAKRGWWVPSEDQLRRYLPRMMSSRRKFVKFLAMSDCSKDFAHLDLVKSVDGIEVIHLSWNELANIANSSEGNHSEKRLLRDLSSYLRTVGSLQNTYSNMAYVVSLGRGSMGGETSWIDVVEKYNSYFHPVGKRWPKEPPNYIAFRYHGRLQSIHHIDSYYVTEDPRIVVPGMPDDWDWTGNPHFVYQLGPSIRPERTVKAGKMVQRNNRVSVMLDLLLTCDTLSDALVATRRREWEG